jgi:RNA polymerase sigma factor (sigma-70 family)
MALARNGLRTDRTDARLVTAVRRGDHAAFEALYQRHHAAILSFCRHLTGRREDAEDAVQHTFMAAYRELVASDGDLAVKPWLFTVARNRCLSLLRARRVREHGARLHSESPRFDGLNDEVERREDLRALVSDLGRLPEPQRAALLMSELEALTHAEIAQVLGIEAGKVRSLVFQARRSLISTREARDTSCGEIRMQLSTMRGASLRRRTLRRHVHECEGCREFETAVRLQRRDLALILPVTAGVGLREGAVSAAAGAGGASAAGGAAGATALGGGGAAAAGAGGGFLGGVSAVQVTLTIVVAGGGVTGLASADVPTRLGLADARPVAVVERHAPRVEGRFTALTRGSAGAPSRDRPPGDGRAAPGSGRETAAQGAPGSPGRPNADAGEGSPPTPGSAGGRGSGSAGDRGSGSAGGRGSGPPAIPPGLAKKGESGPPGAEGPPSHSNGRGGGAPPGQSNRARDGRAHGGPQNGSRPGSGGGASGQGNGPSGAPGQAIGGPAPPAPPTRPARPDHAAAPHAEDGDPGKSPPPESNRPADPGNDAPLNSNRPQK